MLDLLVVGGGPAGFTAALYGARAGLKVRLLMGPLPGGQLTLTLHIENYPGYLESHVMPEGQDHLRKSSALGLVQTMEDQCKEVGVEMIFRSAKSLCTNPLQVVDDTNEVHAAGAVVVATGAYPKKLGVEGEAEFMNRGVSTCATCDGNFYRGQEMAVIGGGNTAVEEAIYLSKLAKRVHLIHRRDRLRAEQVLQDRLTRLPNLQIHWNSQVKKFCGTDNSLKSLLLAKSSGERSEVRVGAAFVAIGYQPNTGWCSDALALDEEGYLTSYPHTSVRGVFAAGDMVDKRYRQAITAAAQGCMAAMEAINYLSK